MQKVNRRYVHAPKRKESLWWLIFLLLLFLSVVRVIDRLPEAEPQALPAMALNPPAEEQHILVPQPAQEGAPCSVSMAPSSGGLDLRGPSPKILIYHTHTTEAYTATAASPYVQTSSYRTADGSKSVIAVGEALARRLEREYGFSVIHDTTDHEPPSLKTAYERSEQTMRAYLEQYPSLILFIDIHRDASSDTTDYVLVNQKPTARLMCVVGQGAKYSEKPNFDENYALASALTRHLRAVDSRLARDVRVKTGRYNQHVGRLNLLIEVGHNANTLEQALNAVPSLAESLALSLADMPLEEAGEEPSLRTLLFPHAAGIDKAP